MTLDLSKLAYGLLRLADFCPLCGDDQAKNFQKHTKCPNMSCQNYDVEYSLKVHTLSEVFGSPLHKIASGLYKLGYGEIARIVYEADPKAALNVATRYQNDLPLSAIRKLEKVVIEFGTPDSAYLFAKDVKEADVKLLEKKVLSSGHIPTIYVFAKNIEGADIKEAENIIVDSGNSEYIRLFALNVEGANLARLEQAITYTKSKS